MRVAARKIGAWSNFADHGTVTKSTFEYYNADHHGSTLRVFEAKVRRSARVPRSQEVVNVYGNSDYDVMALDVTWTAEFAANGWLQPLDDRINADNIDTSVYVPKLMDLVGKVDGVTYMLPFYNYSMGIIYRHDLMNDPENQKAFKEKYVDTGKVRMIFREFPFDGLALRDTRLVRRAACTAVDEFPLARPLVRSEAERLAVARLRTGGASCGYWATGCCCWTICGRGGGVVETTWVLTARSWSASWRSRACGRSPTPPITSKVCSLPTAKESPHVRHRWLRR